MTLVLGVYNVQPDQPKLFHSLFLLFGCNGKNMCVKDVKYEFYIMEWNTKWTMHII